MPLNNIGEYIRKQVKNKDKSCHYSLALELLSIGAPKKTQCGKVIECLVTDHSDIKGVCGELKIDSEVEDNAFYLKIWSTEEGSKSPVIVDSEEDTSDDENEDILDKLFEKSSVGTVIQLNHVVLFIDGLLADKRKKQESLKLYSAAASNESQKLQILKSTDEIVQEMDLRRGSSKNYNNTQTVVISTPQKPLQENEKTPVDKKSTLRGITTPFTSHKQEEITEFEKNYTPDSPLMKHAKRLYSELELSSEEEELPKPPKKIQPIDLTLSD